MAVCNSPKSPDGNHKEITGVSNRSFKVLSSREVIIEDGRRYEKVVYSEYAFLNIICQYCGNVLADPGSPKFSMFIDKEIHKIPL